MASLVESGKYGAINTTDTSTNGFYVIMFTLRAYRLQENITIDGKIITSGELVVKEKHLCSIQIDTNRYWNRQPKHHVITVPTGTILHPQLEVNEVTYFQINAHNCMYQDTDKKIISRQPIFLTDSDYDYILEEIGCQYKIEFERDVDVYSDDMED